MIKSPQLLPWFDLQNHQAYIQWRTRKCAVYPATLEQIRVDIEDIAHLDAAELEKCHAILDQFNMLIYRNKDISENKNLPLEMGAHFGLQTLDSNLGADEDAVTEIKVKSTGVHGRYIPYTQSKLSWHTDGYYNSLDKQIRAMLLHCVQPAAEGGDNALLDHEMAYIYLRDINPDYIRGLCLPDALTIPANIVDGRVIRAAQSGPVFSFDDEGHLHMRYSARKRNIEWKDDVSVLAAVTALECMFRDAEWILRGGLSAGEGLLCNNVLHNRDAFADNVNAPRLLYRLRYYERATRRINA